MGVQVFARHVSVRQAGYRIRQFLTALLARVSEAERRAADAHLPPAAQALFRRMAVADQHHGLAVMLALYHAGARHPALLAAALLHDVGKSDAGLTPVYRAAIVLLERFWPAVLAWLMREPAAGWRRPFVLHRRHPALGAQWAEQAGCDPVCVSLIRQHQTPLPTAPRNRFEQLLAALQAADKNH